MAVTHFLWGGSSTCLWTWRSSQTQKSIHSVVLSGIKEGFIVLGEKNNWKSISFLPSLSRHTQDVTLRHTDGSIRDPESEAKSSHDPFLHCHLHSWTYSHSILPRIRHILHVLLCVYPSTIWGHDCRNNSQQSVEIFEKINGHILKLHKLISEILHVFNF